MGGRIIVRIVEDRLESYARRFKGSKRSHERSPGLATSGKVARACCDIPARKPRGLWQPCLGPLSTVSCRCELRLNASLGRAFNRRNDVAIVSRYVLSRAATSSLPTTRSNVAVSSRSTESTQTTAISIACVFWFEILLFSHVECWWPTTQIYLCIEKIYKHVYYNINTYIL